MEPFNGIIFPGESPGGVGTFKLSLGKGQWGQSGPSAVPTASPGGQSGGFPWKTQRLLPPCPGLRRLLSLARSGDRHGGKASQGQRKRVRAKVTPEALAEVAGVLLGHRCRGRGGPDAGRCHLPETMLTMW